MSGDSPLSTGCLTNIFQDSETANAKYPVPILQCLHIKPIAPADGSPERFRVVLSDGERFVQCMLATQINHVVNEKKLLVNRVVRVKQYQANAVKGKKILVILDLEVIESLGTPEKIGKPQGFDDKKETTPAPIGSTSFYGAKQEDPPKPKMPPPRAVVDGRSTNIYPIEAVSPYTHKWTIKARVTVKSDIRTWHKNTGDGKLFSVNLLDESGEIRATAFNEQVDQFYDLFQEGSVYYISSPCKVQLAKKQFSNLPNDYELTLQADTVIEKAEDQQGVPQVRFNFCSIGDLRDVEKDATVDIIGVLKDVDEVSQLVSKSTGKPYEKRDLTMVDDSNFSVRLTIWGKTANAFDAKLESVVAFKGVKVSDFGGRSLSLLSSGTMALDPDIPEAHRLKGWYDSQGRTDTFSTHNSMGSMGSATGRQDQTKLISQVKDEQMGMSDVAYFTVKATVVFIMQKSIAYPACMNESCNKKVTDMGDGTWRCESCNANHPKPQYRYILGVNVCDHTGQLLLSCFDDVGKLIMGMSADELMEIKEEDEARANRIFEAANCRKFTFRCRAKLESFQDQERIRYQVMNASPIDFKGEAHRLAELIKQYSIQG